MKKTMTATKKWDDKTAQRTKRTKQALCLVRFVAAVLTVVVDAVAVSMAGAAVVLERPLTFPSMRSRI